MKLLLCFDGENIDRNRIRICGERVRGLGRQEAVRLSQQWNLTFLLYLLILKVGHEPMPPTVGTNVLGRKVLYLPSFFTYGECAS